MVTKSYPRRYRIASLLHEALVKIIPATIDNGLVTIRRIDLNNELSTATVYYVFSGATVDAVDAILNENREKYRHQLAKKLNMRRTPLLQFVFDQQGLATDQMRRYLDSIEVEEGEDNNPTNSKEPSS